MAAEGKMACRAGVSALYTWFQVACAVARCLSHRGGLAVNSSLLA